MALTVKRIGRTYSILDGTKVLQGGFFSRGGAEVVRDEMERTCLLCSAEIKDPAHHPFCSDFCASVLSK